MLAVTIIGFLFIAVAIFAAGMAVGFHKAAFDRTWRDSYEHNFGSFPGSPFSRRLPNPHGASGQIVSVSLPTFTIVGPSEDEKVVKLSSMTIIRRGATTATSTDLVAGENAIVLGHPDTDGSIDAVFIRLSPAATSTNTH